MDTMFAILKEMKDIDEKVSIKEVYSTTKQGGEDTILGVSFLVAGDTGTVFSMSMNKLKSTEFYKRMRTQILASPQERVVWRARYGYVEVFRLSDCTEERASRLDWVSSECKTDCVYLEGMEFKKSSAITLDCMQNIVDAIFASKEDN